MHAPLRGILSPNSVSVAHYASFIGTKSPTKCDAQLAESIKKAYPDKKVLFVDDFHEIANYVEKNSESGDLVLTMGAGDIYKVGEMILEK